MSFQSLRFLAFLTVTVLACLGAVRRSPGLAKGVLTAACFVFYLQDGGWSGLLALAAGLGVSMAALQYLMGEGPCRRTCLTLAVCWHIAVLVAFKYVGFLTGGAVSVSWAPLGLSFFTFQQLWLLKEVYTGQFHPANMEDLLLYAFFFPTVVSGPILRPGAFFPQLCGGKFLHPDGQDFAAGFYAISIGTAKKVLLADNLGAVVNNGWARMQELSAPGAWLVILGYTLQLYFDFSGYCDIAAGTARLFGLRLPINFNSPYRSLSIGEFWKRWHITLTAFLRECLYFPLGGSRKGTSQTYRNILIVFLTSGLWHGAGWTFLIWGGLHGLGQIVERVWGTGRDKLPRLLRWAVTFAFVNAAWVFFRAPSVSGALSLLRTAVTADFRLPETWMLDGVLSNETVAIQMVFPSSVQWLDGARIVLIFGTALIAALWPRNTAERMENFRPTVWRCVLLAALAAWSILSFTGVATFIYSNF